MTKLDRSQAGQSLVEAIIGVTILIAGLVTTMALGIMTIRAGQVSQSRTTADNLAREGIEVVRNIRDTNWLKDAARWDAGLCQVDDPTASLDLAPATGWSLNFTTNNIDSDAATVRQVVTPGPNPIYYFTQAIVADSKPTIYHRLITLEPSPEVTITNCNSTETSQIPNYYTVTSEVKWNEQGATHSTRLIEQIYNWRP